MTDFPSPEELTPLRWFQQIQSQLNKALDDMSASLCTLKEGMSYTKQLPSKGLSQSQVLDKIREYETLSKTSFITRVPSLMLMRKRVGFV